MIGSNPSSGKGNIHRNTTLQRLARWAEIVDFEYDFDNVIPYHVEVEKHKFVDHQRILSITKTHNRILTLGRFSSDVLKKLNIPHYSLPHPSPRNRLFNEKGFEERMLAALKSHLTS